MKPTHGTIIYNCNLYLSRLDNLKGIYEGSSCEFKCVWIDDECMSDGWQICLNIKYANCKEGQSRF